MSSIGDIFLRLLLDDADFEKNVVARAQKAGDKAGLSMGSQIAAGVSKASTQIGQTLAGVGQNLTKTGRSLITNLTLPILGAGAAVGKLALDFDTAGRQIVGLTDVTGDELDGIREKILALGPAVGKGPQELIEAFYFIASAGFKADEAMEVLETSARAAAAGLGETQTIAQVLGGVINAYGRENITAAKAADILTEAVSQGTAEASGLANVIGNVVPGAAALGVSFDQVTAAMAGMTLTGVGVEESATSLIQIFSSLQKPTVQAEEALKGLGLSSAELRRQLREEGLLATLRTLEERFQGNETAAAAVFGNIRALRGVTALLTLDSEQLNAVFAKVADSTGRMGQAYEETEGPQRDLARSMAEIQATAIELGTDVLPIAVDILKQLAGGARELGQWWRSLDDGTKKLIVQLLAMVAVAGPLLLVIGKLVAGLGALFKAVGFLSGAKGIPLLMKNLGKAGLIGIAIAAAFALIELGEAARYFFDELIHGKKATDQLRKLVDLLGDEKKAVILREWGIDAERFTEIMERTGVEADEAFQALVDSSGDVTKAIGSIRAAAGELVDDRSFEEWDRRTQVAMHHVADSAEEVPEELAATLENGQFVVGPAAEEMVDPIDAAMRKAVEDAGARAREINEAFISGLTSDRETFKADIEAFIEDITSPYKDAVREADIAGTLASKGFSTGLRSQDSADVAKTVDKVNELLEQYRTLEPGILEVGTSINPALQAGIDSNLDATVQWLQDNVTGRISDPFDLADVLDARGYEGIAAYVRGQERARKAKLYLELNATRKAVNDALGQSHYGDGYNVGDTYAKGLAASRRLVTGAALRLAGEVRALLRVGSEPDDPRSPLRGITTWGPNLVATIAQGMRAGVSDLAHAAATVGAAMVPQVGTLTPAFTGLTVPSATLGAPYGDTTEGRAANVVNNTWVLNVDGIPRTVDSKQAALDELERLGETWG